MAAMAVRSWPQRPSVLLLQRRLFVPGPGSRNAATATAPAKRAHAERKLLEQQKNQLEEMEKDLMILESGKCHFRKEKDLWPIKDKWRLSAKINGSNISNSDAREAVCRELQERVRGLNASNAAFPEQALTQPVAALPAPSATAGAGAGRETKLLLVGGALLGFAGLAAWQLWPTPTPAAPTPASSSRGGTAGAKKMAAPSDEVAADIQACKVDAAGSQGVAPPTPASPSSQVHPSSAESSNSGAKPNAAQKAEALELKESFWNAWPPAQRWAIVAVAALGIAGAWWLLSERPPPPPAAASSDASVPAVLSDEIQLASSESATSTRLGGLRLEAAEASVEARQAAEVVFENAPKDGQAWDMSASIRGIPGAVAQKAGALEKKG